jgi:hypothetical protein
MTNSTTTAEKETESDNKRDDLDSLAPRWATHVLAEDEVEEAIDRGSAHVGETVIIHELVHNPETGKVLFLDRKGTVTEESINSPELYVEDGVFTSRIDRDGMVASRPANREEGPWNADTLPIWLTGLTLASN